ncbi:Dihydrolipoyllysine-residue acetyltransferase component of pyruvate dehydrogenase complex [Achromobacter spanius]|uniref:dihydrolipoamide acetyltransferase family protein n=1 Tax=Achromobacter spanius TaxID=217203 RepID=UPI000C2BC80B|nr:dihydrolipoamide acetyltransferase family protein [Achromobacter spanius]AUA56145.1 2-oxo acid dehydrogenase subunit E2 [Achromobacter spanius]CAB3697235.1 Dihydrolipoyllysine-residue acetyltransferase component of pyruvate dehydrogenase complex [Achromobacter spanius]SPT39085.1 Dihydrolipoyllysine-residue acetyltransferase component of pyruvate dehydrogenase complex [Achromobacter denitrificans]VEE56307.1 Dihydrolipoyllysine-residue acetyltransferase component of pyruvate dehydrogenase comp
MDIEVVMPAIGAGTTEGKILQWLKQSGDTVKVGDILAEIETDKAVIELEAVDNGVLDRIHVEAGDTAVPVGDVIATLMAQPRAEAQAERQAERQVERNAVESTPAAQAAAAVSATDGAAAAPSHRLFASPSARRLARLMGVDLQALTGSGPNGRIVRVDIEHVAQDRTASTTKLAASSDTAVATHAHAGRLTPHTSMRATIARRLVQSKQQIPHFYLTVDCRMDTMLAARESLNRSAQIGPDPIRYSLNDLLLLAVSRAVARVPEINAQWTDEGVLRLEQIDLSIAVALDTGLITPILRDAGRKGLHDIATQVRQLTEQARGGRLRPEQFEGGSLTVSNLGMHGVQSFAAIINPPQAAILAAGAVTRQPVVDGDALAIGHVMSLTLSADHRVVDGAVGARFLKEVRHFLEHPIELIL